MTSFRSVFWDDLDADLQDPEFRAAYLRESERIAEIDARYGDDVRQQ